jgi:uncharacterized protein (DUF2236 family)
VLGAVKERIGESTRSVFSHGTRPLEHTLDHPGDAGLLGPDSVSWRVIGDTSAFVGGVRALLIQTAHPEVAAGVDQHSRYRDDPLGRLNRTAFYVTETTYGALPEVAAAVKAVRTAHRPVHGSSERALPYRASDPAMAAWVHNVLTDSFLVAYRTYGPQPLSDDDADRFVEEQTRIGALLDAAPLPTSAAELSAWVNDHPALASSAAQKNAIGFLRLPPLPVAVQLGYQPLLQAALATVPPRIRRIIGLWPTPVSRCVGGAAVDGLRWALGPSPALQLATMRARSAAPAAARRT